jgi:RimJ/RimL family protein N-acetyltransferase
MVNRFAWGVIADGVPAAVGRYARTTTSPSSVDVGITVVDEHQGRGLGLLLVQCLAVVVRASGFTTMEFDVLSENTAMLRILERLGADTLQDGAIVHATLEAAEVPSPPIEADRLLDAVGSARGS